MSETQNIVVVGGGLIGLLVYRTLSAKLAASTFAKVILVEPRDFLVLLPSTLRAAVTTEGNLEEKSFVRYNASLTTANSNVVRAKVAAITDEDKGHYVTLDNGETIDFAYLVLATGNIWKGPCHFGDTKEEILESIDYWRSGFKTAENIVLVGAGAVGLETAGELRDLYPNKPITIIHSQALPMNDTYPEKWRKNILTKFEKRGIDFAFNDVVSYFEPKDGKIITRNGKSIAADLIVPTFGSRPNTEFVKSLGSNVLTARGHVEVKATLQLSSHPRIFAVGDIVNWKEEKQVVKGWTHADVVVGNINTLLSGGTNLKEYKGSTEMIVLTNGNVATVNGGSGYFDVLWGIIIGDFFTRILKSKTLGVDQAPERYGLN